MDEMDRLIASAEQRSERIGAALVRLERLDRAEESLSDVIAALEHVDENTDDLLHIEKHAAVVFKSLGVTPANESEGESVSLEANSEGVLKRIWQAILDAFDYIAARGREFIDRYRRATLALHLRARNTEHSLRSAGRSLSETKRDAGMSKLLQGSLRMKLPRLGRAEKDQLVFDTKCIQNIEETGELLAHYMRQDAKDADGFVSVIKKDAVDVERWGEDIAKDLWGLKKEGTPVQIKGSDVIGGKGLFITPSGQMVMKPTVDKPNYVNRELLRKNVAVFSKMDNVVKLASAVLAGVSVVRDYNNAYDKRIRVTLAAKKELETLIKKEGEDMSSKRKVISSWSKVAFRRSELVSLSYIKSLGVGEKVAAAFL